MSERKDLGGGLSAAISVVQSPPGMPPRIDIVATDSNWIIMDPAQFAALVAYVETLLAQGLWPKEGA